MTNVYPLVSIITATFNSGKTLERCILSVIDQCYPNIELIIIDGGSQDNTIEIIKKYETKINYWVSEPDAGIYNAWNKGLMQSKGDWIAFLGSDDYYLPNAIKEYVDFINHGDNANLDFISSKISLVNKANEVIATYGEQWNWKKFRRYMNTLHVGMFHNKWLFKNYGLFDETYKICGDYEFLLRLGKYLKADFLNKVTVHMSEGGISNTNMEIFSEVYRAKVNTANRNKVISCIEKYYAILVFKLINK